MIKKYRKNPIALILTVLIVSACTVINSPRTTGRDQTTSTPLTLTIWHHWHGAQLATVQAIFNQYMLEHKDVTIVLDTPQDLQYTLGRTIPTRTGPDIISWGNDVIGSFARNGYIADMGNLGVTQDFLDITFESVAINGVLYKGKIWAIPESQDTLAIVYNKALVKTTDLPSDPLDFNGLLIKAKEYAEANPGKYLVCNQGLGAADAYYEAPIYYGFGVPGFVDDAGKVYVDTPEAVAAGYWIKEFSSFAPKTISAGTCKAGFLDGTYASWWTDLKSITMLQKTGINYGILAMGKPFVGIEVMMITTNAVNRGTSAVSLDLIKYFTNPTNQIRQTSTDQIIPASSAALNDPQVLTMTMVQSFAAAARNGISMPTTQYAEAQWAPVGEATLAIWNGTKTPEEALSAAQTAIEAAITSMK